MRVAITDNLFPDVDLEKNAFQSAGYEFAVWNEKRPPQELLPLVEDADVVLTQFASINADVIANMRKARAIVRYGIGVDNVDLDAARERRIPVCNVPDYCIDEVADHTIAFILSISRQVVANCMQLRTLAWRLPESIGRMRALRDLRVGVVGFGRIGREVAARLRPFKCRIVVHDPVVSKADIERAGCEAVDLPALLSESDVITLHCPSTPQTRHLINRDSLARTKSGVILVNVARGSVVDESALIEAIQSGHVSAAALDVFEQEPAPPDHPLLKMENVIVAPHVASVSEASLRKLRETVVQLALRALRGESLFNVVNGVASS